jgi:UDP-glucuronate decarboxylase
MARVIFDKKNVLVAGGAGFLGSHLCDALIKDAKVICVDNFCSSVAKNIDHLLSNPDFIFINHDFSQPLDLENHEDLKKFKVSFQGIQEIYNLACPMSAKNFMANRERILASNSSVMKNTLDLAVKYSAKYLQFSSSVVYGHRASDADKTLTKEEELGVVNQLSERSAYDEGKRFAESMVANYRELFNVDTKIIRVFRVYGPRMPLRDDQMMPDFIFNAFNNEDLVIFGDENFSSSFCYVDDVIDGAMKVMESPMAGPINVGSEVDIRIVDVAKMIVKEINSSSKIRFEESKVFMSRLRLPDIHLIRNELGWMPVVTLENGLKKTILDLQASKQMRGFDGV